MPQILLELTNNVREENLNSLLQEIHQVLSERLPAQLLSCKSRIMRHADFLIGEGKEDNAFVHLSIGVIKGRTIELKDEITLFLLEKLKSFFAASLTALKLQLSITIYDLPEVYHKN